MIKMNTLQGHDAWLEARSHYIGGSDAAAVLGLNPYRELFQKDKNKSWWWQMIQLLPSSYNQRRTVMLNYAVLKNIYNARRNHKLDEWNLFCGWIERLPYSELITGKASE